MAPPLADRCDRAVRHPGLVGISDEWCLCVRLLCRQCGWEGNQEAALTHTALTGDLPGFVLETVCGETPCRTRAAGDQLIRFELWRSDPGAVPTCPA